MASTQTKAPDFGTMLTTLTEATTKATEAKATKADAPEAKLARSARVILSTFPDMAEADESIAPMPPGVTKWLEGASAFSPDSFDRTEGDTIATLFSKLLDVPEDYRPVGFDQVAEGARAAVDAWIATKPGRRAGSGTGESTTPENQKLATFGIGGITLTMASDALDAPVSITHRSTWSSLSNEINKVAKKVDGTEDSAPGTYSYQKVDPTAATAWRAFVEAVKANPTAEATFPVTLGKGVVTVTAKGEKA